MIDFTNKGLDKNHGFGKINAFLDGDTISPKLNYKGDKINSDYIKRNQNVLSQSKTGISTYQYEFCGKSQKR